MASTTRALILSLKPFQPPPSFLSPIRFNNLVPPPPPPTTATRRRISYTVAGVGGGGLSDTRKSEFSRELAVIARILKKIEPLDSSDISKCVSETAKHSMKQTISTMLGLLPSDQFSVSIRVSKLPLHRILFSSIITGYTLWNAEYRMSLMRNFDLPLDTNGKRDVVLGIEGLGFECREIEAGVEDVCLDDGLETCHALEGLSSEALDYIRQLEAELCSTNKELDAQKQDTTQTPADSGNNNNLLHYLRSLESDMVLELSQPSSIEVKEVIHELVQNTMQRFYKDDVTSDTHESVSIEIMQDHQVGDGGSHDMITTTRDYLAKLLFWCMMLGHHLRGLENRLHLSCVVGLL